MVDYAPRPPELDGCWSSWTDKDRPQVIRTSMENGDIKVRRRTSGLHRVAQASVTLRADRYDYFVFWYRVLCQSGIIPTNIWEPRGVEAIWRFSAAPDISWPDIHRRVFQVDATLERLPGWQEL